MWNIEEVGNQINARSTGNRPMTSSIRVIVRAFLLIIGSLLLTSCTSVSLTKGPGFNEYRGKTIAVIDVSQPVDEGLSWTILVAGEVCGDVSTDVSGKLLGSLMKCGDFRFIEGSVIEQVLGRHSVKKTDLTPNVLAQYSGELGIDGVVTVDVGGLSVVWIGPILSATFSADAKLVDLHTREIVWSATGKMGVLSVVPVLPIWIDMGGVGEEIGKEVAAEYKGLPPLPESAFAERQERIKAPVVARQVHSVRNVHVLVVGIQDYEDANVPRLKYSADDAKAVYDFFAGSDLSPARRANVHFVGDAANADGLSATKSGIMEAIERYLVRAAVHEDDMVILYFAGHGDTDKEGESYYIIPKDAKRGYLRSTAIGLEEFQNLWDRIPAQNKLLIADACNSGGFSGTRNLRIRGVEAVPEKEAAGRTVVLSACSASQKSLESDEDRHGLFTQVLLEGLQGKCDDPFGDRDGRVTMAELAAWLEKTVPARASRAGGEQTPVVKVPQGWDEVYLTR